MPAHKLPTLDPATLKPDDLLTTGQLAKLLPGVSAANTTHRGTVRRWGAKGVTVAGRKVKLRTHRTPGGQRLIRWGDWLSFRAECDRLRGEVEPLPCPTPSEFKRAAHAAGRELDQLFADIRRETRK